MKNDSKTKDFYARLKQQLQEDTQWPSPYLFKFIVPADPKKVSEIKGFFKDTNAKIETRDSSKGTFTSVSIQVTLDSPDAVIKKYQQVSSVEGVISL